MQTVLFPADTDDIVAEGFSQYRQNDTRQLFIATEHILTEKPNKKKKDERMLREKGGYVRGHVWDEDEKTK